MFKKIFVDSIFIDDEGNYCMAVILNDQFFFTQMTVDNIKAMCCRALAEHGMDECHAGVLFDKIIDYFLNNMSIIPIST